MTFEEFQKSKVYWADVSEHPFVVLEGAGLVYDSGLVINLIEHKDGPFHLMIANQEWVSFSLIHLEIILHEWALEEQIWD